MMRSVVVGVMLVAVAMTTRIAYSNFGDCDFLELPLRDDEALSASMLHRIHNVQIMPRADSPSSVAVAGVVELPTRFFAYNVTFVSKYPGEYATLRANKSTSITLVGCTLIGVTVDVRTAADVIIVDNTFKGYSTFMGYIAAEDAIAAIRSHECGVTIRDNRCVDHELCIRLTTGWWF